MIPDSTSLYLNSSLSPTTQFGSLICDSDFCEQSISLTYSLSSLNCSGINENVVMQLAITCSNETSSSLCDFYMSIINGRTINIPFSLFAEWCPKEETTGISTGHFLLFSNASQISNGDSLTTSRNIDAEILVNIDKRVTGTSLSSALISALILSDGNTI